MKVQEGGMHTHTHTDTRYKVAAAFNVHCNIFRGNKYFAVVSTHQCRAVPRRSNPAFEVAAEK